MKYTNIIELDSSEENILLISIENNILPSRCYRNVTFVLVGCEVIILASVVE